MYISFRYFDWKQFRFSLKTCFSKSPGNFLIARSDLSQPPRPGPLLTNPWTMSTLNHPVYTYAFDISRTRVYTNTRFTRHTHTHIHRIVYLSTILFVCVCVYCIHCETEADRYVRIIYVTHSILYIYIYRRLYLTTLATLSPPPPPLTGNFLVHVTSPPPGGYRNDGKL